MFGLVWDFIAGISVAGVLLPESVAYAQIAGVPAAHAIVAGLCGLVVYALLGKSRFAIVAPTSSAAAIIAAAVGSMSLSDPSQRLIAVAGLVIFAGLLFVGAGVFKLGSLSAFISRPVLRGFTFGLAVTIVIKQIPLVLGLSEIGGMPLQVLEKIYMHLERTNVAAAISGGVALILIVGLKEIKGLPAAFSVLVLGIAASLYFDLAGRGVVVVGLIDLQGFHPAIPELDRREWFRLAELAPPLFLIIFAESWGSIRNFALRYGDSVDANRELLALGGANLASGLMQGLAVGAGFSGTSANESAGARSRMAGLIAAIAVLAMVLVATRYVAVLPQPVLAAVVISALMHALNPQPLLRLWKINRDQYVALAAMLAVLFLGVLDGMLVSVALSLLALVQRLAQPVVAVLGQIEHSHDFVDVAHFPNALTDSEVAIYRPARPMFFANADTMFGRVDELARASSARAIIVSLEESPDFDSTAADALSEFRARLEREGRWLFLARVRSEIVDLLATYGDPVLASAGIRGFSVADAYDLAKAKLATSPTWP